MRFLGIALLSVALLGGCGGGGRLTRKAYVAKIDAACTEFAVRERAIGEPHTIADLVDRGSRVVAAFEDTILKQATTLDPPAEIAGDGRRLADLARRQRDVLRDLVAAAKDGDALRVQQLAAQNRLQNAQGSSLTRRLGATACAGG